MAVFTSAPTQVRKNASQPPESRRLMCTARPNWLSLSTTFFNKEECHKVFFHFFCFIVHIKVPANMDSWLVRVPVSVLEWLFGSFILILILILFGDDDYFSCFNCYISKEWDGNAVYPSFVFQRLIEHFQQLMGRTWRSREVAQRCLTRTSTSVRQWRTVMEVKDSCVANKDDSTQTNERKRIALLQLPRKRVQ